MKAVGAAMKQSSHIKHFFSLRKLLTFTLRLEKRISVPVINKCLAITIIALINIDVSWIKLLIVAVVEASAQLRTVRFF